MDNELWTSPDGRISKTIITKGNWGLKPTENSQCSIKISQLEEYGSLEEFTIGDSNSEFERLLDKCLSSMMPGELAKVSFKISDNEEVTFTLKLCEFISDGFIYEWNARKKYDLASSHKAKGKELFHKSLYKDASNRFGKGLKILCSIPIDVTEPRVEVDGVAISAIESLKTILYNNLASCYLKSCNYETVLLLCDKVFDKDKNNVKALYKYGIAKCEMLDYEGSQESFKHLLTLEPDNKAVLEKIKFVNLKVAEDNIRVNSIIKRMFDKT